MKNFLNIVERKIYYDKINIKLFMEKFYIFSIVNPKDIYSELRDAESKIKGKQNDIKKIQRIR